MKDPYYIPERHKLVERILADLKSGRYDYDNEAIRHLIRFFESARTARSYIEWVINVAPYLKRNELLELADLSGSEWENIFYPMMVVSERLRFPGLVEPLVSKLADTLCTNQDISHLIHLGSGPMEIDVQTFQRIHSLGRRAPVHFIGIDLSKAGVDFATKNFSTLPLRAEIIVDRDRLFSILSNDVTEDSVSIVQGDALEFLRAAPLSKRHLIFHSLFRHHLNDEQKSELDIIILNRHLQVVEYDGYRSLLVLILFSMGTWNHPVIMNGAIFSNRRYDFKREIRSRKPNSRFFFPAASYIATDNI